MIQIVLLRNGHVHPRGFPDGLAVSNSAALFANLGALLEKLRAAEPDNLIDAYYTVAHHTGLGGPQPSRSEQTFEYQTILPFDIDMVDTHRAWDYLPIVAKVLRVSQQRLVFICSGNGLHVLAHLATPIRSAKFLKELKPHYNELLYKINAGLADAALPGKADPSVFDAARILRLPNTVNSGNGKKPRTESRILQDPPFEPIELDLTQLSGLDALSTSNVSAAQIRKNYPRPDFQEVMTECRFMTWLTKHPEQVHEPQFMAAVGLFAAMSPGDKALYQDASRTAKEIAGSVYDGACSSKSLARGDFEKKWEHGSRYGAPRCATVSQNWVGGCETCPHFHKINTPLALRSQDHIASAENGYWVLGKNGQPLHPDYSDLAKVYRGEHSYVTTEPDRIFTFDNTHYKETAQLMVKAWVEKKVGHEQHLRESHCVEFVKKVLRSNAIGESQVLELFEQTVRGKLNCQNGVVDVRTGELLPHSSGTGFRYVLPYDFEAGQVSEFFLDWLSEMMQHRIELMDAVLDLMAYCLWPVYDDHVFGYLVGEGANGKSTLLHVVHELVGRQNYSTVSLSQLAANRFAPASLEGKLVNLSEESSGTDLSHDELNIIKDLTGAGTIQVERKGQHPFALRNTAKLIFSANKPPRFHEQGHAIRRRLLVIPFDHKITTPDSNIEKRLFAEVPKICSMLISRIQDNLKANKGRFLVSRGGQVASEAQDRVLLAGNSVVEWGKACLESSVSIGDKAYISCTEAYARYTHWCQENNYKPLNSTSFGYQMLHGVLTPAVTESKIMKVGGKTARVYPYTQWKEEL